MIEDTSRSPRRSCRAAHGALSPVSAVRSRDPAGSAATRSL